MNPRMPYYPPQAPGDYQHHPHNGYNSIPRWNEMRVEPPLNNSPNNWDRNNRGSWKRNRNWQPKFIREQQSPYNIPKKGFNPRFPRNRYDNGTSSFYDGNQTNWVQSNKPKQLKNNDEKDMEQMIPGVIASKKKRKPMSKSYPSNKWDEKDAEKALQAEKDFIKNLKKQSLIIRFPDPDLSKEIVQKFHPLIESVHFPHASTPRYCFAHLEESADIEKVVSALEKIPFGQGFLSVDIKKPKEELIEVSPKDIDPYTLYVGNLPMNVTKQGVIQQFPGCTRIDIGHPQQLKNTRYAFVRFSNVDDAVKAYKNTRNTQFESRSLIVRFRRINGNVGVPGETKQVNTKPKSETQPEPISSTSKTVECLSPPASVSSVTNSITSQIPDINLVKEEPVSDPEDVSDIKPNIYLHNYPTNIKKEIKTEPEQYTNMRNEDDIENAEDDDDYLNDNFQYMEGPTPDEYEDEDQYEDDDAGSDLDLNDTFLPYDDDGDF